VATGGNAVAECYAKNADGRTTGTGASASDVLPLTGKKNGKPKEPNLAEVNRAATETQRRLGIEYSKKDFTRNTHVSAGQYNRSPGYFPGKHINKDS
jgi:hypothetical protein